MDVCLSVDGIWRMYWKIMGGERVHVCVSQERKNNTYHTKFRFVTLLHIQTYVRRLWWLLYKFSHAEHTISWRPVPASLSLFLSLSSPCFSFPLILRKLLHFLLLLFRYCTLYSLHFDSIPFIPFLETMFFFVLYRLL